MGDDEGEDWQAPGRWADPLGLEQSDVDNMVRALMQADAKWSLPDEPIAVGEKTWRPHLVADDSSVLHVHASAQLRQVWLGRIEAAAKSGRKVVVAGPPEAWYYDETLADLCKHEVAVIVLEKRANSQGWSLTRYRSIAELIAMRNLRISPARLQEIGTILFDRSLSATSPRERGWRFEDFLCLLFSQVSDFSVLRHNYRNETEEIDLVLKNHRVGGRALPSSPIALVSAKNTKDPVGVPALIHLESEMQNRRGQCKLGFLCASRVLASTVSQHELRYSQGDSVFVLVDGQGIRRILSEADQIDEIVEQLVIEAALK